MKYKLNNLNVKKKIYKLKNGINVILIPLDNTNLVNIDIKFKLGNADEYYCKCPELVHYMEHLVYHFTSNKYKSFKTISNLLEKNNGETNAETRLSTTRFYIKGLYNSIDLYLDIISNGIFDFYLDKSIVDNEKEAVFNELNQNFFSDSLYKFNTKKYKYLYKDKTGLLWKTNKHIKFLKKYNPNNITKFIKDYLLNEKIILTISYDKSNTKEVIKLINKHFNKKIKKNKSKIRKTTIKFKNNKLKVVYLKNASSPNKNQNNIDFTIHCKIIPGSKRHYCLVYLCILFNAVRYSTFYDILRSKLGLIYTIYFGIEINTTDYNYSKIVISTNCSKKNLPKLIYEILNIFDNIILKDFTLNTLDILYKNIIRDHSSLNKNDINFFSEFYSNELLFNKKIKNYKDRINIYKSITLKDLRKEFKILKHNLLNKGVIFYNGNKNFNKDIEKINKRKFKINYVSF